MEQRIACSVLIREISLTRAQCMELDLTQANAVAALTETESGELSLKERLLLRELFEQMLENRVRFCLQKDDAEKSQKRTEREDEKE